MSEKGLALLREFEGFSTGLYLCPAGLPTIGYGHVVREDEEIGEIISREEAEILLQRDVAACEVVAEGFIRQEASSGQWDAMLCLMFNIGGQAFRRSTLLRKFNNKDIEGAAAEFGRWVFGGGRKLAGLERRRKAERTLFEG
jgi:lysozyme